MNRWLLTLLLLLTLAPFYMLVITSLKDYEQILNQFWLPAWPMHFGNYAEAFKQIYPYLGNSIIITAGIVACVLINSSMAGFAFVRYDFFGKNVLYYLIIMLMMVPGFLLLIPQFILFKQLGLLNTYWAQIFGPMAGASAMATMLMRTFFEGLSKSLLEAAEMEGAGDFTIFTRFILPLSVPIISTVAIINALLGWNNYIWPLVATSGNKVKPVILALSNIRGSVDHIQGIQFAGYVIASVPLLLLFVFATKSFVSGITAGAVKG
ncbi:carbohydrate ABC transporter permease [Paenibacillus hemerocallicola]|jgi:ABC-type glycerol-3-phosphate transport system permease component|uniref:Carbohydrate ABC transporter permease n=1 Tax=Paenibacillus hemerocallicola TaxID=1172614 RepID=A0A5C4T352_9BACL|nr:carbohydrate ABC transporter permease [Paenibacillus hemerocallicola]TNJ63504.1 carbohydrate ABC transporter permease [Paenibacillus hemerocallicola]